jgi:hypothetical protein
MRDELSIASRTSAISRADACTNMNTSASVSRAGNCATGTACAVFVDLTAPYTLSDNTPTPTNPTTNTPAACRSHRGRARIIASPASCTSRPI